MNQPEENQQPSPNDSSFAHNFAFDGSPFKLFGITLKNFFLTIVTIGIYRPWATVNHRKFTWSHLQFAGRRFSFHGSGVEIFLARLKFIAASAIALIAFVLLNRALVPELDPGLITPDTLPAESFKQVLAAMIGPQLLTGFLPVLLFSYAIPWLLFSSLQYLCSRSRWGTIHLSMKSNATNYVRQSFCNNLLKFITLGIYWPWAADKEYRILATSFHAGHLETRYTGQAKDLVKDYWLALVLMPLSLGIYGFWFAARVIRYRAEHTWLGGPMGAGQLACRLTGGQLFALVVVSLLGMIFSLGFAYPWLHCRGVQQIASSFAVLGTIDFTLVEDRSSHGSPMAEVAATALDTAISM